MLQPGEGFPSEASSSLQSNVPAESTGSALAPSLISTHTKESFTSKNELPPAAIAGVVLGAVVVWCVILAVILLFVRPRYWNRSCDKTAEAPVLSSSSCRTSSMTPDTVLQRSSGSNAGQAPGQNAHQASGQAPGRALDQASMQSPCISPCSPGILQMIGPPPPPLDKPDTPVFEKCSNSVYELQGPE